MMLVLRRFLLYLGIIVLAGSISGLAALNDADVETTTPTIKTTTEAPTTASTTEASTTTTTTEAPTTASTTEAPTTASTPEAPTTTAPPTPSPNESINTYKVAEGNTSCLMMTMEAHLEYNNDKNQSAVINVTDSYSVDSVGSNCSYLIITSGANNLTFEFKQSADNKTYTLDQVAVALGQVHAKKSDLGIGQVAVKASYVCNSGAKVDFEDGNVLVMRKIQYQAFTMDGDKFSTGQVCAEDNTKNITIPLVVGCALGGLLVVVFIAYCFGRRRVRLSYEAM